MKKVVLTRTHDNGIQTIGYIDVFNDKGIKEFSCCSLELPYRDNKRSISCIPKGQYIIKPRTSEKYKKHYHVTDVIGRTYILIHSGNYNSHTKGCILVGSRFKDINFDGQFDVVNSNSTLKKLLVHLNNKTLILEIN